LNYKNIYDIMILECTHSRIHQR